jgi:hypothetical protein
VGHDWCQVALLSSLKATLEFRVRGNAPAIGPLLARRVRTVSPDFLALETHRRLALSKAISVLALPVKHPSKWL